MLAQGKARYVGDHVACVVAETLAQAKDAAELVEVDYERAAGLRRPGARARRRRAAGPRRDRPATLSTTGSSATRPRSTPAFASAAHVTKIDLVNNRLVPNAIEPRAAIGDYDAGTDDYTLYTTSQNPHVARLLISALRAASRPSTSCA